MFLGRKLLTPCERITFTENQLDEREKADLDKVIAEAQEALEKSQERHAKYNVRRQEVKVNRGDTGLGETHVLISAANNLFVKFAPKYKGPFEVL